jgi:dTDP-4-amino-4,6-dideoxygalactose transaminase
LNWKVPLADISFGPEEHEAVQQVLSSGWLTMGGITQKFEKEFCELTGAKHAIAVTNATAALHMACVATGCEPGDELIVPSLTFVATANAVRYTGATPVFADIVSEDDLTISPEAIEKAITPHTKAIIVMHYAGYACDMPKILALADEHGLPVIEDAAHAVDSYLDGKHLGTLGSAGCFSFFSNKNMTTGEGGMIVTNDDALAGKLRLLRSHGMTSLTWDRHMGHAWSYDVVGLGYNYRIDEMRSALGRVQLSKLKVKNARRRELTELYRSMLRESAPQITVPFLKHKGVYACHVMPVLLPDGCNRVAFMDHMKSNGIQTSIHYPPIHTFSAFRDENKQVGHLLTTEEVAIRELTLPMFPEMTDNQVGLVVQAVAQALSEANK